MSWISGDGAHMLAPVDLHPFIHAMLEARYRAVADRLELEALDEPWACGGDQHPTGNHGHDNGPATHMMILPCGWSILLCAGRTDYILAGGYVRCAEQGDDHKHPVTDISFIPIPEAHQ